MIYCCADRAQRVRSPRSCFPTTASGVAVRTPTRERSGIPVDARSTRQYQMLTDCGHRRHAGPSGPTTRWVTQRSWSCVRFGSRLRRRMALREALSFSP
jgi:hypothetical protein